MVATLLSLLLVLGAALNGCTAGGGTPSNSSTTTAQQHTAGGSAPAGTVTRLVLHEVVDREGTQLVVSHYLLPQEWTVDDKFSWEYRDTFNPTRYKGTFKSSDGSLIVNVIPDISATWMRGAMGVQGYRPPKSLADGVVDFLKKSAKLQGLKVISTKTIPGKDEPETRLGSSITQSHSENGIVRIEFLHEGKPYEGEIFGNLSVLRVATPGIVYMETINWTMSGLTGCSAPKGRLDECKKVAMTMKSSAKVTLKFYNRYVQIQKMLENQAYQRIYQAGQISKIISQTNDEISKSISDSYWERQRSNDRINQNFSDYVRGVDRYNDPSGSEVQLPSGYTNAWVNNRGEYLMSDQTGYDPNVELKEEWKPLEKK
jgi:hypothetical protein